MSAGLNADSVIVRATDTISADIDGEIVLISVDAGEYFGLDVVASEIWRRIEMPVRVGDLCAGLVGHFEGDPAQIERDAMAFLDRLAESKLIQVT